MARKVWLRRLRFPGNLWDWTELLTELLLMLQRVLS